MYYDPATDISAAFSLLELGVKGDLEGAAEALNEYYGVLGKATAFWNVLHEQLFQMYEFALPHAERAEAATRWYGKKHDGNQRQLLESSLNGDLSWLRNPTKFAGTILPVLAEVGRIQERRNKIVHCPCSAVTHDKVNWSIRYYPAENPMWRQLADENPIELINAMNTEVRGLCMQLGHACAFAG